MLPYRPPTLGLIPSPELPQTGSAKATQLRALMLPCGSHSLAKTQTDPYLGKEVLQDWQVKDGTGQVLS